MKFRYGKIVPSDISSSVWAPNRELRPLKPCTAAYNKLQQRTRFYTKLEESMLKEGVRNPIFANAFGGQTHVRYGTSRLWIASKHGDKIELPIIIADYDDQWTHFEELETHNDIQDKFDIPIWVVEETGGVGGITITPINPATKSKIEVGNRDMMDDLKEREQAKYEKVWRNKAYRKTSPGERSVLDFLDWYGKGGKLADLGCGTGRASLKMGHWFEITLVDHASNCRDRAAEKWPFYQQCLWELDIPKQDVGFCCDVMEHIPEEKVDLVLEKIREHCPKAYLRIFLMKDNGKFTDETLHMTVKPCAWWEEKIAKLWDTYTVECLEDGEGGDMVATFKAG
jgi:hypothetical protein